VQETSLAMRLLRNADSVPSPHLSPSGPPPDSEATILIELLAVREGL
jgi:hypothetical protein